MIDAIVTLILGSSIVTVLIIIARKFPTLAAVDTTVTTGTIAKRKHSLIEERLRRKISSGWGKIVERTKPVTAVSSTFFTKAHKKLVDLEHEYKVRSLPVFLSRRQRVKIDHEISAIIDQARALMIDKEFAAAEEKIMQAIRLEPRSVPAFEVLGELYMDTKDYGHAKEVYSYLLKLTGDSDAIYQHESKAAVAIAKSEDAQGGLEQTVDLNRTVSGYHAELARAYTELAEYDKSFTSIQEAARLEPNNPKILDQFVTICILAGKKQFAEDAVARIEAVNPENSKITGWREQIEALKSNSQFNAEKSSESTPLPT